MFPLSKGLIWGSFPLFTAGLCLILLPSIHHHIIS
ncbi:unnamed protein product [Arabidopsis lyrata]|nr:unnamed protein product [Arabidopsis lyrata]